MLEFVYGSHVYVEKLRSFIAIKDLEERYSLLRNEYESNRKLFLEAIENYFDSDEVQQIPVRLQDDNLDTTPFRFLCRVPLHSFDYCLVTEDEDERSFAMAIGVTNFAEITSAARFPSDDLTDENLKDMLSISFNDSNALYFDLIKSRAISKKSFKIIFGIYCQKHILRLISYRRWDIYLAVNYVWWLIMPDDLAQYQDL